MKTIYTKSHNPQAMFEIKKELRHHGQVKVYNMHESFYGFDFPSWLENKLKGFVIEVTGYDCHEDFPKEFVIRKP